MFPGLASTDVERMLLLHTANQGPRSSQERSTGDYKLFEDPPLVSATITDLCNEPLFFSSYLSDEEDFSSSEADDMSFSTDHSKSLREEDALDDFDVNFPELLAEECTFVEQQCNQAKAVSLIAAGRPKVIQVSRVEIRSSPMLRRYHTTAGRLDRSTSDNDMPSTPLLEEGLRTPLSAYTPSTPRTPSSVFRFDPMASPTPSNKSATPTSYQTQSHYQGRLKQSKLSTSPPLYFSHSKPSKMVARPANERSPIIQLPPFPGDDHKPARPWGLRKDAFNSVHHLQANQSNHARIRKVESAVGLNRR